MLARGDDSWSNVTTRNLTSSIADELITGNGEHKLRNVVSGLSRRHNRAKTLKISPTQWTVDAIRNDANAVRGPFHPYFDEALKERCPVEIEGSGHGLR